MKAVIFIISVAFACGSAELLGEDRCSWGPSYWCSHLTKAKECGAVDHCVQAVWTKQKLTASSNPECQLCETVLNFTRKYLADKATQKEIINVATYFCNATSGIPQIKTYCDEILPLLPTIFTFLANPAMTSAQLCSFVISDCKASRAAPHKGDLQEQRNGDICTDCQAFIGDIEQLITSNSTKSQVVAMVQQMVCGMFGQVEEVCDQLVDTYLPPLFDYLGSFVDPDLDCRAMGFCSAGSSAKLMKYQMAMAMFKGYFYKYAGKSFQTSLSGVVGCVECSTCEGIVGSLRGLVQEKTTQDHILNFLENEVCMKLPSEMVAECKQTVAQNGPPLLWIVWQSMDPTYLCSDLGMCPSISPNMQQKKMVSGAVECTVCKDTILAVNKLASSSLVQNAIAESLENYVCPLFGASESQCKKDISLYTAPVMKLIVNFLQPEMCSRMSLCDSKVTEVKENPMECTLCDLIFQEVERMLVDDRTESAVKNVLDKVCDQLPTNYKSECETLVSKYEDQILQALADKIQPDMICKSLGICTSMSKTPVPVKEQSKKVGATPTCVLCEFVMDKLDSLINENATEGEITKALEKVCSLLPQSISAECNDFVEQYGPLVVKLLLEELSPQVICSELGLCAVEKKSPIQKLHRVQLTKVSTSLNIPRFSELPKETAECILCKTVAGKVEEMLKQNKTEQYIMAALDAFCDVLPQAESEKCTTFVNTYTPGIITLLLSEVSPDLVCQSLSLCAAKNPVKGSLDKCDMCVMAFQELETMVTSKSSEKEIKAALDQMCNSLPGSLSDQCKNMVSQYEDAIIKMILADMDPKEICTELKLCSAKKVQKVMKTSPGECQFCTDVISEVVKVLNEKSTQDEIKTALDSVCSQMGSLADQCKDLVNQYEAVLIALLAQELNPKIVCQELQLCTAEKVKVEKQIKADSDACTFCTDVVSEVIAILKEKSTQDEIKTALDSVCARLPTAVADQCKQFVAQYEAALIELLAQELNPKTVCQELQLCTAKKVKASSEECVMCESLLLYAQEALKENKTVQFIEAALDKACDQMLSVKQQCKDWVAKYGTQMAIFLSNEIQPNKFCQALLKCTSTKLNLKDSFGKTLDEVKSVLHEKNTKLYFKKHLLGGDRCKNPGYYCASRQQAKKCGYNYQNCRRFKNLLPVVRGL